MIVARLAAKYTYVQFPVEATLCRRRASHTIGANMKGCAVLCVLVLACCASAHAQTSVLNSNSKANATYAAYNGYNATGFMDTNAYYGPYSDINTTTNAAPKPNVSLSVEPEGCTILSRQFGIANYTGDLPCTVPGGPPSDSKQACVVRL